MICPRCTVAEISAETHTCVLCGYSPGGVALETEVRDTLDAAVDRELADLFHIESVAARGARSTLYVARGVEDERRVLLRVLPRQPVREARLEERFQREMAAAKALDHAHIVSVLAHGATASLLWCTMKHVEGRSLAALLQAKGAPLDVPTCLRIMDQVASALEYAHRHGVIHGDVRPANVLLEKDEWVRLTGFGTGRILSDATVLDTEPADHVYAAPEDASLRQLAPSSDQYALAFTVLECLTGSRWTPGKSPALSEQRPEIPGHVSEALRRALRPIPAERFATVPEFVSALGGSAPAAAAPGAPTSDAAPAPQANPRVLLVDNANPLLRRRVIILASAVVAGIVLLRFIGSGPRSQATPAVVIPTAEATAPAAPPTAPPETASRSGQRAPRAGTRSGSGTRTQTPSVPRPPRRPAANVTPGMLSINSTPWGEVYIDDRLVGTTPLADLPLAPGEHRVRVVREGFIPFEQTVSVAPEERVRLTSIVLQAANP